MPHTIKASSKVGIKAYTIPRLIQLISGTKPPSTISFPLLGNPAGATTSLQTDQAATIAWTSNDAVARSVELETCACTCYYNATVRKGYVYHTNTGYITPSLFEHAMDEVRAFDYNDIYIIYAHTKSTDKAYEDSLDQLIKWGIPSNQILEVTNLPLSHFGLNNKLQLGY